MPTTQFPALPVGAWPEGDGYTFRLWAPKPKSVELVILGSGAERHLKPDRDEWGYWTLHVPGLEAGRQYAYILNGKKEKRYPDPAARHQPTGVHGPSALPQGHAEPVSDWRGHSLRDMVIYELHIGTFTEAGTFDAAIERLDYLTELGVNALEVMPLNQFPGGRNWGYDGVLPFAVVDAYGGPEGLKRFVRACHERGIAVLIDVIYNHLGPEGNYLPQFGPFFTDRHHTPWGKAINMDDKHCDGVRNFFIQNVLMWLRDYGCDGLRLDAIHAIKDYSAVHFLEELSRNVDELAQETGREYVLLGECDLNSPRYLQPRSGGGYGLDGQWVDEFHHALHGLLTSEQRGYYEDFGTLDHLRRALETGYVYTGQYSRHRQRNFGTSPARLTSDQFVVFLQNHDQVGNRMIGDRLIHSLPTDKYLLAVATYLLSPFVPLIFMGEEYGERNPFPYFVSHGDKGLVAAVRKGRAAEFKDFQEEGEVPDPQAEATFNSAKLSWQIDERIHDFYRACLRLRREWLPQATFHWEDGGVSEKTDVLRWRFPTHRSGESLYLYGNFSDQPRQMPAGRRLLQSFSSDENLAPWGFVAIAAE